MLFYRTIEGFEEYQKYADPHSAHEINVIDVLKKVAPGKNFILGATLHGTPIENLKKITRIIKIYGKYPMEL